MPLLYWALEDIQQEQIPGGFIITTKSDVACHMWLRWTYKEPQKHAKPVERRGLLVSWDARFCFVAFCDVEQEEAGDTFTHTFHVPSDEPPPVPPTAEWPFYEPWGTSLTQYNPWIKYKEPEVPTITFEDGVIKIENPGYEDCGITYSPPVNQLPIAYSDDKPLKIAFNNTEATANSTSSQTLIELIFRKDSDWFTIYLCVACGAEHDDKKPWCTGYVAGRPYGWYFVGTGEFTINLLDWFKTFRADLGLDTNPAGWFANIIAFALGTFNPAITDHLKNDYIGCYLPQTSLCNMQPWLDCETRYFYFWATNAGEKMKSTSCIFSKHFTYVPLPVTKYFYSDPHPEVVCVDGYAHHYHPGSTWDHILHGDGTHAYSQDNGAVVGFYCSGWDNLMTRNNRAFILFDTRELPAGKEIVSAEIQLCTLDKGQTPDWGLDNMFKVMIVTSIPISNTNIVKEDYLRNGSIPLSNKITWAEWAAYLEPNIFTLNAAGIAHITPEGISKFGLKEYVFDALHAHPPCVGASSIHVSFHTAEAWTEELRPRLKVIYYE